jgi:hypothetical protein
MLRMADALITMMDLLTTTFITTTAYTEVISQVGACVREQGKAGSVRATVLSSLTSLHFLYVSSH